MSVFRHIVGLSCAEVVFGSVETAVVSACFLAPAVVDSHAVAHRAFVVEPCKEFGASPCFAWLFPFAVGPYHVGLVSAHEVF